MGSSLVSILTPSYNQGAFLGDCIASVANQTYAAVEHVICDGASTDATPDVLAAAPSSVRWVSEADRGQAHALNKALSLSRGSIIGWLNSDDAYFDPGAIEAAVAIFEREPDVDVVYGHAALVGADGELLHLIWAPRFSYRLFRLANFIVQPTVFLRRGVVDETMVDERLDFAIDRELWLRLSSRGHRFARLDRIVAIDRHHGARKVLTMEELGEQEDKSLDAAYGVSNGLARRTVPKLFRIGARLYGVTLLRRAYRPAAFDIRVASPATLLRRQVATRRRRLPLLGGGEPR